jgi:hypothetical protein
MRCDGSRNYFRVVALCRVLYPKLLAGLGAPALSADGNRWMSWLYLAASDGASNLARVLELYQTGRADVMRGQARTVWESLRAREASCR